MSVNNYLSIKLTSTVVEPNPEGYYDYDQMCFLFPHEPIRRELNRGKDAFEKVQPDKVSWKGRYIRKWLQDFLIPVIRDHHEAEEKYLFPSYVKLGVQIPSSIETGHEHLVVHLNEMEKVGDEMVNHLDQQDNVKSLEKFQRLQQIYSEFYRTVLDHLAEEETFWLSKIREKGEQNYKEINDYMHKETKTQKSAKLFIMSVFDSMGYEFDAATPTHDPQYDTRWCGERLLNEKIINKIPYFVRAWIFPPMNRQYQYYKQLIRAVATSDVDNVPLEYVDQSSLCIVC